MQSNQVPLVVLAAALSASAMESELLNSERIERQFGSYGIEVVSTRAGIRRSNLFSTVENGRICRTYAVVKFVDAATVDIDEEHAKIQAGGSIGAVFKEHGWEIVKETLFIGEIAIDDTNSEITQLMQLQSEQQLAMHIYQLMLRKGDLLVDYATVVESHHPDYLSQDDLIALFPDKSESQITELALNNWIDLVTSAH